MKTRGIQSYVSAVSAIVLLLQVSPALADGQQERHTLRVLSRPTGYTSTQADPTGNVFVQGDEVFLGGIILRFADPYDQIGTAGLHCTATGAEGSELLCEVAFTLPGGKITGQTLFDLQGEWLNETRKLAITGGTGAYRNAGGEITVTTLASGDEKITFKFGD